MAKSFEELSERTMSPESRRRANKRARINLAEMLLAEIRGDCGLSQTELARILGIKQPSLSKIEQQDDMMISTLDNIVTALGGKLHVSAVFPGGEIRITQFDKRADPEQAKPTHREPTAA